KRHPHLRSWVRKIEIRGHHANDLVGFRVKLHGSADDFGVRCKLASPQRIAQQSHFGGAVTIVIKKNRASKLRRNSKDREEACRCVHSVDMLRVSGTADTA